MITQDWLRDRFDYRDGNLIRRQRYGRYLAGTVAGGKSGHYIKLWLAQEGKKKLYLAHRLIFLWHHGYMPKEIDHIDRNGHNNRIENLRSVTSSQNRWNTTPGRGAHLHACGKYRATIYLNNKQKHLGYFDTAEEANAAYLRAKAELHAI